MPRLLFRVSADAREQAVSILTNAGLSPEANLSRVSVPINKQGIEANAAALMEIAKLVLAYQE